MKYNELNKKTAKELWGMTKELREELFHLRLKNKTAQLDNKSQIQKVRRDIARVQTCLSQLKQKAAS